MLVLEAMMRSKLAIWAALVATLVSAQTATGAGPLITDPAGDHPVPAGDIVSADLRTGRDSLAIELTVAGDISMATPYAYSVNFTVGGCRYSAIYYVNPAVTGPSAVGCRDSNGSSATLPPARTSVHGSTITWVVPLRAPLRKGAVVRDIDARTAPSGLGSGGILDDLGDVAYAYGPYRIGG